MNQPEHDLQSALISWWALQHKRYKLPEFSLFAIPNGGLRNRVVAGKLKAEGVRKGIADLMLAVPNTEHHGLYIEMKYDKNGLSAEQKEFANYVNEAGYLAVTCWDWQVAAQVIDDYLIKRRTK